MQFIREGQGAGGLCIRGRLPGAVGRGGAAPGPARADSSICKNDVETADFCAWLMRIVVFVGQVRWRVNAIS